MIDEGGGGGQGNIMSAAGERGLEVRRKSLEERVDDNAMLSVGNIELKDIGAVCIIV